MPTKAASPKASRRARRSHKASCWATSAPPAGPPARTCTTNLPVARALEPAEVRAFNQAVAPYKQQIQLLTEFQQTLPDALTNVASR
ncbi:hypothetical protein G6F35_018791 [Rhizopus arrhizus]|nr:hypothetical protein G6F35_018791 [Rhizopus arrhizus]